MFAADAPLTSPPRSGAPELSYEDLKKQFASDEVLDGLKVTSFTETDVTVVYKGRYIICKRSQLTPAQRSKVDALISSETENRRTQAMKDRDEAARLGMLREVDGVVYNLMKPAAGWTTFSNVRVIQKIEDGLVVNASRTDGEIEPIFVLHLPQIEHVADNDKITFVARQSGSQTFISSSGVPHTLRRYDCGTAPGKANKPSMARAPKDSKPFLSGDWSSSGTGFFITEDGYIATCNHVVDGARKLEVRTTAGRLPAKVYASDPSNDVAIIKVTGAFSPLAISTNRVSLGQSAFTIGFPNIDIQGFSPKYTDGKVSSLSGIQDDASAIQISVPVQPGNSGGALTDSAGNVIGIVVARLNDYAALRRTRTVPQNVNYAIKSSALAALVQRAGLREKVRYARPTTPSEEAVSTVEKAAVLILVAE